MVGVGGKVACPIQATIVVPDGKDVLTAGDYWLDLLPKDLLHQGDEILGRIPISGYDSIAFFL